MSTPRRKRSPERPAALRMLGITAALAVTALAMPGVVGCRSPERVAAPCPGPRTCLPPLEAPTPVGTREAEAMSRSFVLRVHDVRDILDLMPVVQLVGPDAIQTVPPEDALVEGLLRELDAPERVSTEIEATDSGAVLVRGPEPVQAKIAAALDRIRTELVRREVSGSGSPFDPGAPPDASR